jgi:methylenetetrahydrofolate reductase (NADPH)
VTVRAMLEGGGPVFSFEYFPPKTEQGERNLMATVRSMKDLRPGFVSVTCGAGGSTKGKTLEWADQIKNEIGIEAVVHMTCLGRMPDELRAEIAEARERGIENVLALRGDFPRDGAAHEAPTGSCRFAIDLIRLVREEYPKACLLGACYPEGHVDAESRDLDMQRLKEKCDAGLDVLVTQLFFDNEHYFSFVRRAREFGVTQPVVPGIMPVTDVSQVERFTKMCGATIPPPLLERLQACGGDKEAVQQVGVEHAIAQCRGLLAGGAPGIHFYTLNRSPATRLVVKSIT